MLSNRQSKILNTVIEEFINTATPISSGRVFEIEDWGISCPTIRNEMADLTELGYLEQPHTSAGRMPTQKGYRFFVDYLLRDFQKHAEANEEKAGLRDRHENINSFADDISIQVKSAVLFASKNGELKYVGLKRVFENPEFQTRNEVIALLEEIDRLENSRDDLIELLNNEIRVFIGSENPLFYGHDYGMISKKVDDNFISVIGPMRMDYRAGINLFGRLF